MLKNAPQANSIGAAPKAAVITHPALLAEHFACMVELDFNTNEPVLTGQTPIVDEDINDLPAGEQGEFIQHARLHLAVLKRPKAIIFTEALPKSTAGKILKRLLREELQA